MNTTVKIKLWLHLNRHNHSLLFYRLRYESKTLGTKYRKHSKWWKRWEHPAVKDAFGAAFAGFAPWLRFSGCPSFHLTPGFEPSPSSAFLDVASFLPFSTKKNGPCGPFLLVDEGGVEFSAKTAVSIENTAFRLSYAFYMRPFPRLLTLWFLFLCSSV